MKPTKINPESEILTLCKYFDWERNKFCRIVSIEYGSDFWDVRTEDDPMFVMNGAALKEMLSHMMGLK